MKNDLGSFLEGVLEALATIFVLLVLTVLVMVALAVWTFAG